MPQRYLRPAHVAILGFLCGMGGARAASTPPAVPAETHKGIVLVFPFDNGSRDANLEWLGEGLAEITVERLEDRRVSVLSRQERLSALEKMGLPATAEFSHATMIKVAAEADADDVIFGRYLSDGKNITLEARVLRISPPGLSRTFTQTGSLRDLLRAHARLAWQLVCAMQKNQCPAADANLGETIFTEPPASLTMDAFETFVKGLLASDDEARLRDFREAARQEPVWDRPPFELGQAYFARSECESALPWYSRVPPDRPDGPEASFNTGVCLLLTRDLVRAEATFSALLDRVRSQDRADHLPDLPEFHKNGLRPPRGSSARKRSTRRSRTTGSISASLNLRRSKPPRASPRLRQRGSLILTTTARAVSWSRPWWRSEENARPTRFEPGAGTPTPPNRCQKIPFCWRGCLASP
jgi:TolB-like protein